MSLWPMTILLLDISVMCKTSVPNIFGTMSSIITKDATERATESKGNVALCNSSVEDKMQSVTLPFGKH